MSERADLDPNGDVYFPKFGWSGYGLAVGQCCFALVAVLAMIAAPPASGRILLVPTGLERRDDLARLAVDAGARLVAPGPMKGSLIVSGESAPLIAMLMPGRALVLNAAMGGCGEGAAEA